MHNNNKIARIAGVWYLAFILPGTFSIKGVKADKGGKR